MADVIYVRNRLIPGAEWIEYKILTRYANRMQKLIPINLEIYVNEDRQELLLNGDIAGLAFNRWTVIRFDKEEEFKEFLKKVEQTAENLQEQLSLWGLLLSEEDPSYSVKKIILEEDYEIRTER